MCTRARRIRARKFPVSGYGIRTVPLAIGLRIEFGRLIPPNQRRLRIELIQTYIRRNQQPPDQHSNSCCDRTAPCSQVAQSHNSPLKPSCRGVPSHPERFLRLVDDILRTAEANLILADYTGVHSSSDETGIAPLQSRDQVIKADKATFVTLLSPSQHI